MKDFISKITFGFLMAQLFPGAVVVFAIHCAVADRQCQPGESLWRTISEIGPSLFKDTFATVVYLLLSVGVGMCIHGLNWAVLAWLEHVERERDWGSVRGNLWWHKWPIWVQLLSSPLFMLVEIGWLVTRARTADLIMEENVVAVGKDSMDQFNFLQDFYVHFGQFFAHMAYALLIAAVCACSSWISRWDGSRGRLAVFFYFCTSVLFQLGRIQLGSLFKAESVLVKRSAGKTDTKETKSSEGD